MKMLYYIPNLKPSIKEELFCAESLQPAVSKRMKHMFPINPSSVDTRNHEKFYVQPARTSRLADSAIPYVQRLFNENE